MGHTGKIIIEDTCTDEKYEMTVAEKSIENGCDDCKMVGETKSTIKGRLKTDEDDLTIHADICGPSDIRNFSEKNYFATFTNARSRYTDVELLSPRDKIRDHLEEFAAWAESQSGVSVKRIHSHNAKEFKALVQRMKRGEINRTQYSAYILQSNVLADRINRFMLNKTRAMLKCSGLLNGY